jgi:endonuclease/exonuclease/phosphatase family metal-dependent hydrolase
VRLLTWNVHKGIGGIDRHYSPRRVAAVLRHHRPDLVLLQEVDDGVPRSRRDRQVQLWGDLLGYPHRAFVRNVRLREGSWGNAILSRFPLARVAHIDLSFPLKKRRGAIFADVVVPAGRRALTLHVVNLHLGLSGVERRYQVRRLLAFPLLARLDGRSRIVIAGDTNDWAGALPRGALRAANFACVTRTGMRAIRTFPARRPVGSLDAVYCRGPIEVRRVFRSRARLARLASDHLPVVVDFELRVH